MNNNIDIIRSMIGGLDKQIELANGEKKSLINFDNAATTPALIPVIDAVRSELEMYGSIGRGFSLKSDYSTDLCERARVKIMEFCGADPDEYTCFFTAGTTDGLNKLALSLIDDKDDTVLVTRMEHHSNDLPWRNSCRVVYSEVDERGRLDFSSLEDCLKSNEVKYLCITAASNVTGYVNDVYRAARLAHRYGAMIIVDAAQIVSHRKFSVLGRSDDENIDFIAFSAHKMYSPFGGGAVVGLKSVLDDRKPRFCGGGTVNIVSDKWVKYKKSPFMYESGSHNFPAIVGLNKAIDIIKDIGFDYIEDRDRRLTLRLVNGLKSFEKLVIYGDNDDLEDRVGVVAFNFEDINSHFLAERLAKVGGIATRRGAFCAHPYVWRLMAIPEDDLHGFIKCEDANTPGMIRVSFGIYNTEEEVDEFLHLLASISKQCRIEMPNCPFKQEY